MKTDGWDAGDPDPRWWNLLERRLRLAYRLFRVHPTMPATAFWRIFEAEVASRGLRGRGRALDLGCGDGSLASALFPSAPGLCWVGLEKDGPDARLARASSCYEEVYLSRGEEVPFDDSSFDVVFSNCVLEHVEGLDAVLFHVGRVLKPGGRFAFTVPSERFRDVLIIPRVLRRLGFSKTAGRYLHHLDERLEMVNVLSMEEWNRRLAENGLRIRHELPYATRRVAAWWEILATLTGGLAYLTAGGRSPLRKIQQSAGMVRPDWGWLGALSFAFLLPVILIAAVQRTAGPCAGRYVEAVRDPELR